MAWRVLAVAAVLAVSACGESVEFDARVDRPAFPEGSGPVVLFDEGHHNRHEMDGTYEPFAELVRNDGFQVRAIEGPLNEETLRQGAILVIVTAQSQTETNAESAFTPAEVRAVADWVEAGHSLLLVTDHYPFPNAAAELAHRFGLDTGKGMVFDSKHFRDGTRDDSRLIYSTENGLLAAHPITRGRNPAESVRVVETFTGDAFKRVDSKSGGLLNLADSARIHVGVPTVTREGGDTKVSVEFVNPRSGAGWAQGVAFDFGKGRVVAYAEAAMLTAQEDGGRKLGMNAAGNDNRQLVLNSMRWLARVL